MISHYLMKIADLANTSLVQSCPFAAGLITKQILGMNLQAKIPISSLVMHAGMRAALCDWRQNHFDGTGTELS